MLAGGQAGKCHGVAKNHKLRGFALLLWGHAGMLGMGDQGLRRDARVGAFQSRLGIATSGKHSEKRS